eukprot:Cvel_13503.t2-p1 / transcript=Cvel_13503.t2 / gene=Cvel_13503 / organism=Chromera_velia_CCMP2878 / gene_product=hypothetical protein / transcript_product=hypothetical protein / location=Cvel_scaffold925:696-6575(-) / protein_length=1051 / sequence_SO=supercontig / SO=protein_coding / is_pseudo=false
MVHRHTNAPPGASELEDFVVNLAQRLRRGDKPPQGTPTRMDRIRTKTVSGWTDEDADGSDKSQGDGGEDKLVKRGGRGRKFSQLLRGFTDMDLLLFDSGHTTGLLDSLEELKKLKTEGVEGEQKEDRDFPTDGDGLTAQFGDPNEQIDVLVLESDEEGDDEEAEEEEKEGKATVREGTEEMKDRSKESEQSEVKEVAGKASDNASEQSGSDEAEQDASPSDDSIASGSDAEAEYEMEPPVVPWQFEAFCMAKEELECRQAYWLETRQALLNKRNQIDYRQRKVPKSKSLLDLELQERVAMLQAEKAWELRQGKRALLLRLLRQDEPVIIRNPQYSQDVSPDTGGPWRRPKGPGSREANLSPSPSGLVEKEKKLSPSPARSLTFSASASGSRSAHSHTPGAGPHTATGATGGADPLRISLSSFASSSASRRTPLCAAEFLGWVQRDPSGSRPLDIETAFSTLAAMRRFESVHPRQREGGHRAERVSSSDTEAVEGEGEEGGTGKEGEKQEEKEDKEEEDEEEEDDSKKREAAVREAEMQRLYNMYAASAKARRQREAALRAARESEFEREKRAEAEARLILRTRARNEAARIAEEKHQDFADREGLSLNEGGDGGSETGLEGNGEESGKGGAAQASPAVGWGWGKPGVQTDEGKEGEAAGGPDENGKEKDSIPSSADGSVHLGSRFAREIRQGVVFGSRRNRSTDNQTQMPGGVWEGTGLGQGGIFRTIAHWDGGDPVANTLLELESRPPPPLAVNERESGETPQSDQSGQKEGDSEEARDEWRRMAGAPQRNQGLQCEEPPSSLAVLKERGQPASRISYSRSSQTSSSGRSGASSRIALRLFLTGRSRLSTRELGKSEPHGRGKSEEKRKRTDRSRGKAPTDSAGAGIHPLPPRFYREFLDNHFREGRIRAATGAEGDDSGSFRDTESSEGRPPTGEDGAFNTLALWGSRKSLWRNSPDLVCTGESASAAPPRRISLISSSALAAEGLDRWPWLGRGREGAYLEPPQEERREGDENLDEDRDLEVEGEEGNTDQTEGTSNPKKTQGRSVGK